MNDTVYAKNGKLYYSSEKITVGKFGFFDRINETVGMDAANEFTQRLAKIWNARLENGESVSTVGNDLAAQMKAAGIGAAARKSAEAGIAAMATVWAE